MHELSRHAVRGRHQPCGGGGTFLPSLRAFDSPMAMACFGSVTFFPLRPLLSWPFFMAFISVSTSFCAAGEYLRLDFFADAFFAVAVAIVVPPKPEMTSSASDVARGALKKMADAFGREMARCTYRNSPVRLEANADAATSLRLAQDERVKTLARPAQGISVSASVRLLIFAVRWILSQLKGLPSMARTTVLNSTTENICR
jgi:hypothetical protein